MKRDYHDVLSAGGGSNNKSRLPVAALMLAVGLWGVILASDADAQTNEAVEVGDGAQARFGAIAIGFNALARGDYSVALGHDAQANNGATAIATHSQALGQNSIAIGNNARSLGIESMAYGVGSEAASWFGIAMGSDTVVSSSATRSMALGAFSSVAENASYAVALGANSEATRANTISVGNSTWQRQITNVAAGVENTDAANYGQLIGLRDQLQNQVSNLDGRVTIVENNKNLNANPVSDNGANVNNDNHVPEQISTAMEQGLKQANTYTDTQVTQANDYTNAQVTQAKAQANAYTDQRFNDAQRAIDTVAKNAYAGVAAAMAMPNFTPSGPGRTVVATGTATYMGGSALAASVIHRSRNGHWLGNAAVSVTNTGDVGLRSQVGYEF
ncbi:YadA-like family protein [Glaciimonas soli]|uniref:Trimeric autotransporter adhesin n=1 Tax=Glaciimonas soli TaxID=2590999 RepID=A0A843YRY3_9BURK|nr:YadA-like family protein [Glaciimonas soli]MQR02509.1 hypothetical protein [Glaciimonas soli]